MKNSVPESPGPSLNHASVKSVTLGMGNLHSSFNQQWSRGVSTQDPPKDKRIQKANELRTKAKPRLKRRSRATTYISQNPGTQIFTHRTLRSVSGP